MMKKKIVVRSWEIIKNIAKTNACIGTIKNKIIKKHRTSYYVNSLKVVCVIKLCFSENCF